MHGIITCLLTVMVAHYSVGQGVFQPYQPLCFVWGEIVSSVISSVEYIGGTVDYCEKLQDCTGMRCSFNVWDTPIGVEIRIMMCDNPVQLRITFVDEEKNSLVTVVEEISYPVSLYGVYLFDLEARLRKEQDGIFVQICLDPPFPLPDFCFLVDVFLPMPPCPTEEELVCQAIYDLAASVTPPTSCSKMTACDGINCTQKFTFSYGVPPTTFIVDVDSELIVDSCGEVSMILKARSKQLNLDWSHEYTHSDSVPVDQDLTFGTTLIVTVFMQYMEDMEHIQTTIKYRMTHADSSVSINHLLEDAVVPIPLCKESTRSELTATLPAPASDECESWENIKNALEFSLEGGYSISDCVTLPGCQGFNCSAMYDSEMYHIMVAEFHCQEPTYITVIINGANERYSQTFTHNDTVSLPVAGGIQLSVHLVKKSPSMIFVGVFILFPIPGGGVIKVPLVADQLLEVTPCLGITTTLENIEDKENQPFQDFRWTLVTGFLALGAITLVVIVVIALFIRKKSRDSDVPMGNTAKQPDNIYGKSVA